MVIDSAPYRDINAPLPPWFRSWCLKDGKEDADKASMTMTQWRHAFYIAQRLMTLPDGKALDEFNELAPDLMMLVRARWDALRGRPIDWVQEDD